MTYSKLGTDTKTGQEVKLYKASRRQGTYVIAATGVGKSTSLRFLIEQDIKQGIGVCVFDPHGDLINDIIGSLHRKEDRDRVILLDAQDQHRVFGINLYQCDTPTDKKAVEDTVERVRHLFELFWPDISTQPLVSQGVRNSSYAFIDSSPVYGCTMLELSMLFGMDRALRANIVSHLQDTAIAQWWARFESFDQAEKAKRSDMVVNKIEEYTTNRLLKPLIGQSRSTIDFREVIDSSPGKIVLVRMYGDNERMTQLIGALVIAQLLGAALSRQDAEREKRRQFHLYCDEFELYATDDFTRLLKECRKYGMGMTIAHQSREGISLRNKAASLQVGNIIVGRLIPDDAKDLAPLFKANPQPGEPEYKPVMERQFRTEHKTSWEPPEKEAEYHKLVAESELCAKAIHSLLRCVNLEKADISWAEEYSPPIATIATSLRSRDDRDTALLEALYAPFNLDFRDPRVQQYLLTQVYAPGSTLQNPRLKNPKQLTYQFPSTLPTEAENRLQSQLGSSQAPSQALTVIGPQSLIAGQLSSKLAAIKQVAIYRFDPKGYEYQGYFDNCSYYYYSERWKRDEEALHRLFNDRRSSKRDAHIEPTWGDIFLNMTGLDKIGEKERRAYNEAKAEEYYLEYHRLHDDLAPRLGVEGVRGTFGFWPIVPLPEVKELFTNALLWLEAERNRLQEMATSVRSKHYVTREIKIDLGYFLPVYDVSPKFTPSYDQRFGGGLSSPSSISASTERTQRYEQRPGQEEPFTNAWNRTIDELVRLPVGVAWCRVQNAAGELEDHVINLAASPTGLAEKSRIDDRIEEIKNRMLNDGHLRPITDVEQEIAERHARLRQSQAQPISPAAPNQLARKKPITN